MIAAGGTGGHVYPALAVAEAALTRVQQNAAGSPAGLDFTFVGSVDGFERPLLAEAEVPFAHYDEVAAGPLHGVRPAVAIRSLIDLVRGTVQAWRLIGLRRPDALLLTGGWVGLPVALAGWLRRVPSLIYLPDIEPGLTIRMLKSFAARIAVTTEASRRYFDGRKVVVTGYPLRRDVLQATRADGLAAFKLDPARKTLLVFGGSRGARTINHAVMTEAAALAADDLQIIHVTGTLDYDAMRAQYDALPAAVRAHYHLYPYLHDEMGPAFAITDLAVCRSGASTLGELPHFGLPAVLVPYPFAWRYQKVNADWLAERGAAVVLADERMATDLLPTVRRLLMNDDERAAMAAAARALALPDGAGRIAEAVFSLAQRTTR